MSDPDKTNLALFLSPSEYYNSDCVVDNPFYAEPRMECEGCVDMLQAVDMTGKMTPEVYRDGGFEAGIPFKLTVSATARVWH